MLCTCSLEINAPIERVFDCVDDPEKMKEWMQGLEETVYVGRHNPDFPVGTKFKQKLREGGRVKEYDGQVTDYQRPHRLGVKIFCPQFSVQVDYHFASTGPGTRLDYQAEITPNGWLMRMMLLLLGWMAKGVTQKQLQRLKELAERQEV
jgi:carbon monoxide dehydrogenase subunit G